jgi:hypothetical protein
MYFCVLGTEISNVEKDEQRRRWKIKDINTINHFHNQLMVMLFFHGYTHNVIDFIYLLYFSVFMCSCGDLHSPDLSWLLVRIHSMSMNSFCSLPNTS